MNNSRFYRNVVRIAGILVLVGSCSVQAVAQTPIKSAGSTNGSPQGTVARFTQGLNTLAKWLNLKADLFNDAAEHVRESIDEGNLAYLRFKATYEADIPAIGRVQEEFEAAARKIKSNAQAE